jgi:hypothetical protein
VFQLRANRQLTRHKAALPLNVHHNHLLAAGGNALRQAKCCRSCHCAGSTTVTCIGRGGVLPAFLACIRLYSTNHILNKLHRPALGNRSIKAWRKAICIMQMM